MVRRTEPLVVNVLVAALARFRLHEELAGNFLLSVNLRRTWEERAFGSVTFPVHVVGWHGRILNAPARLPALANVARAVANTSKHREANDSAHKIRTHPRPMRSVIRLAPHSTGDQ